MRQGKVPFKIEWSLSGCFIYHHFLNINDDKKCVTLEPSLMLYTPISFFQTFSAYIYLVTTLIFIQRLLLYANYWNDHLKATSAHTHKKKREKKIKSTDCIVHCNICIKMWYLDGTTNVVFQQYGRERYIKRWSNIFRFKWLKIRNDTLSVPFGWQTNHLPPWIPRTVAVFPALSRPTIISVTFLQKEKKKYKDI